MYFSTMCIIVGILTLCTIFASARTSMISGVKDVEENNLISRFVLSVVTILGLIYCTTQPSWWATCIYCYTSLAILIYCFKDTNESRYKKIVMDRITFTVNTIIYWPLMLIICIISVCIHFTWDTTLLFSIPIALTLLLTVIEAQHILEWYKNTNRNNTKMHNHSPQ